MTNTPRIEKNVKFTHTKRNKVVMPSEYMNAAGFKIMFEKNGKRIFPNTRNTGPAFMNAGGFRIMIEPVQKKSTARNTHAPKQQPLEVYGFKILV